MTKAAVQDLARKVVVLRIAEVTPSKLRSLVSRGATGLVIVLPKDLNSIPTSEVAQYQLIERFLATRSWDAAIYFAFDDEYLSAMVANLDVSLGGPKQDRYHIQVATPDATPLTGVTVNNLYGYQHAAATSTTDSDTLPTIAVVASYDSIAAVPGLSFGLDQNGSGTIALLEVARIFNKLYSDFRSQGSYNLLFILTGLDRMNYVATKNWLRNIDSRVLESLEFALCLERLASSTEPLYLHVSKMPKTPEIQSIYSSFESTAVSMSIPLEIVHKKINISDPTVYWQHEQFSRKRIVAATLSASRVPETGFAAGSIFETAAKVDLKLLERNIKFVVEALSKQIYGLANRGAAAEPIEVIDAANTVNSHVISAYMDLFGSTSRFTSLLTDAKTNPFLQFIDAAFAKVTSDSKKQSFQVDTLLAGVGGAWKLYKDKDGGVDSSRPRLGVVEMQAFQVKPFIFDVYLLGAILAYLLVVYIACKQPENGGDVIAILIGR